jgi:hypothetical protein
MSPTNTFFSVMAALSLPLVCMPLPWHLEGTQESFAYLDINADIFVSLEHRDVSVYDVDSNWIIRSLYQLDYLEERYDNPCDGLV